MRKRKWYSTFVFYEHIFSMLSRSQKQTFRCEISFFESNSKEAPLLVQKYKLLCGTLFKPRLETWIWQNRIRCVMPTSTLYFLSYRCLVLPKILMPPWNSFEYRVQTSRIPVVPLLRLKIDRRSQLRSLAHELTEFGWKERSREEHIAFTASWAETLLNEFSGAAGLSNNGCLSFCAPSPSPH